MTSLQGKRTLITGAARGLGLAIATECTANGARVALMDLDPVAVEQAASTLGGDTFAVRGDVTNGADVQAAIAATVERFGGLDVLINNAGIEIGKPLTEMTEDEFDRILRVNVHGVFHGIRYGVPALAQTRGCIINMSSVAGLGGVPLLGAYAASKAAVLRLTETAAVELRGVGIRVNAICPSFIDTEMVQRLVDPFEAATGADFTALTAQAQGRLGTPEEVAQTAVFLASDDAGWVTGSHYVLDNALTASVL